MPHYKLTRPVRAPKAPAGELYPGVIDEAAARELLGEDFDLAVESGALVMDFDPLPRKGWPTQAHADKAHEQTRPITQGAKWIVRCACGFGADSACETEEDAIKSVASAHDPSHTRYSAKRYA